MARIEQDKLSKSPEGSIKFFSAAWKRENYFSILKMTKDIKSVY